MDFLIGLIIGLIFLWIYHSVKLQKLRKSTDLQIKKFQSDLSGEQQKNESLSRKIEALRVDHTELMAKSTDLELKCTSLIRFEKIVDAEAEAEKIIAAAKAQAATLQARVDELIKNANNQAQQITAKARDSATESSAQSDRVLMFAKIDSDNLLKEARNTATDLRAKADQMLISASQKSQDILNAANENALSIAGDAYEALTRKDELASTAKAMENIIKGYGDKYLKPTYSLLDELAENFSHTDAGQQLQLSRKHTKLLAQGGNAAVSDYVESHRSQTAIAFITDAFNGKVDSILSSTKAENHGKLGQQIEDSYQLVNHLGQAFRNTRIKKEYKDARMEELRWAATVILLRDQEREEQREIKEQIREEEKARKEYERAIKETAKEEETIRKAMEKTEAQIAKATDAQKAIFEEKLAELQSKLTEAELKNIRVLSMAQQTRAGHVYVISNIGSFGEAIFKIGMTRRLEPMDRVKELGDASVPFSFDVHAMMYSEDAPGLERELHRRFNLQRLNLVNFRKEFFRVDLHLIKETVASLIGTDILKEAPHFTLTALAHEFHESKLINTMNPDDRYQHLARLLKLDALTPLEELSEEVD